VTIIREESLQIKDNIKTNKQLTNSLCLCHKTVFIRVSVRVWGFDPAAGRRAGACPRVRGRRSRLCRQVGRGPGWHAPVPAACRPGRELPAGRRITTHRDILTK